MTCYFVVHKNLCPYVAKFMDTVILSYVQENINLPYSVLRYCYYTKNKLCVLKLGPIN
jgi:hypothetical protein